MSTFERVQRNIMRDMAGKKTHTAESWVQIMTRNTATLTNVDEQAKFWQWIANPEELEHVPPPTLLNVEAPKIIDQYCTAPSAITDEKTADVELENTVQRNGLGCYVHTQVKTDSETLERSPTGPDASVSSSDEKTAE